MSRKASQQHYMATHEVNNLQQQRTTPRSSSINQEQASEAPLSTDSPELDRWKTGERAGDFILNL